MRGVIARLSFVGLAIVLALALIVPIVLFASATLGTVQTDLAARTSAERGRAAAQATQMIDQEIDAIETDLRLLAARPEIQQNGVFRDRATIEGGLAELLATGRYSFAAVFDGSSTVGVPFAGVALDRGQVVARLTAVFAFEADAVSQQRAQEILQREVVTPAVAGELVTSRAFLSRRVVSAPVEGPYHVLVARLVQAFRATGLAGSIGAIVAAPRFQQLSERLRPLAAPGRTVSLVARDFGTGANLVVLASTASGLTQGTIDDARERELPGPDRGRAFAGTAGEAWTRDGTDRISAYAPIQSRARGQGSNWVVTVADDLSITLGAERRLAEQIQTASLSALVLAGVLATVVALLVSLVERQRRALGVSLTENVRLVAELDRKRAEVELASQAKSRFLASMSHELRTPLNSIIGFSELMQGGVAGPISERQRDYLGDVVGSGKHLLGLINDVLDLSKVEAGRLELHPEDVDLAATIEQVAAIMRPLVERKGLRLELEASTDLGSIHHDGARLRQILLNLASNAVKFTPEGGQVTISALRAESHVEVAVRDSGIGLSEADLGRIFEEFRQIDSSYGRTQQGTGLGLALVKRFVDLMGGTITVTSTPGRGSTFAITLPIRQPSGVPTHSRA